MKPLTEEQLRRKRLSAIEYIVSFSGNTGKYTRIATVFTCDSCAGKERCPCVYDPYNTDGDCLYEK